MPAERIAAAPANSTCQRTRKRKAPLAGYVFYHAAWASIQSLSSDAQEEARRVRLPPGFRPPRPWCGHLWISQWGGPFVHLHSSTAASVYATPPVKSGRVGRRSLFHGERLSRMATVYRSMNVRTSSNRASAAWRPWIYRSSSLAASCSTCPTSTGLPGANTSARPSLSYVQICSRCSL